MHTVNWNWVYFSKSEGLRNNESISGNTANSGERAIIAEIIVENTTF